MKILVTGATSLIGTEVIKILLKDGHEIRSLTRQKNVPPILLNTEVLVYDLIDAPSKIAEGIDAVIHIAAATPGAKSSTAAYFKTNVEGTRHLVEICKEQNISRFIFISSIAAMDKENKDAYALSKKEAEAIVIKSNFDWTILRPAHIIGADKSWDIFIRLLKNKKTVLVPGNGKQLRHPVFFRDVTKAILQVINNTNTYSKKYTLAARSPIGYYQFLVLVRKYFNYSYKIIIVPLWVLKIMNYFKPVLPKILKIKITKLHGRLKSAKLDIQHGINDFNYNPVDIEEGLIELKGNFSQ